MAQTGFTPIQLYYSITAGASPIASSLANGELAINITDGKLFYKENTGTISVIGWKLVPTTAGGTGQTTYVNGQLLIGNSTGNTLTKATLTAGSGISVTNGTGSITLANTGVLSFDGGSTGLLPSTATTGVVSLSGTLGVGYGGTGQTTYTNGQLLIGNTTGNTLTKTTLTAGSGVSISNGAGSITISATGSGGTVTAVTGTAPVVSSGGTTPAISMPKATTSVDGYLSSTDWTTFNNKGSGTVTSVTATSPVASTGGTTPVISMPAATTSVSGYLTSTDWNTFNGKQPAGTYVTSITVTSSNGLAGTVTSGATPAITLSTSITGILKGNGTAISAATSGTDYAPATSGSAILYGNGSGGFSSVTIGTGVAFAGGTLSATGSGGTVTSVTGTAPVVSSGGTTPAISMAAATTSVNGYLTSTDWTTFNGKQAALVSGTNIKTVSGTTLLGSGDLGAIGATYGGTGQTVYAVGDLLYASTTTALSKLADVATGNAIISGGVGVAPSYGKIGLTTHVSGTLAVANGGTGVTSSTGSGNTVLSASPTLTGTVAGASLSLSSLTSGRVTYATTSGLLTDSANLLYSGTDLTVYGITVGRGNGAVSTNTAVGNGALNANGTATEGTAVGYQAGYNQTGSYNTWLGIQAGLGAGGASGTLNIGIGRLALSALTSGGSNTAVGSGALISDTSGGFNVAIGRDALAANTTATNNVAVGYQAGNSSNASGNNVFIGSGAGTNSTTGNQVIMIGVGSQPAAAGDGNEIVIGTLNVTGKGGSTGFISPNGGGVYQGNNSAAWSITSDQRLKKNIVDNNIGLDKITAIQVRNFEYRMPDEVTDLPKEQAIDIKGIQLGAIAQELQQILPDCVKQETTGVLSVQSDNLTWYMINAIKELKAEIDSLKSQLNQGT